jgi:hypothetical protein
MEQNHAYKWEKNHFMGNKILELDEQILCAWGTKMYYIKGKKCDYSLGQKI